MGFGIIVKESWSRSHGRGIIEEHHGIDIMGKESWERNHGKRHHGRGIMGEESWKEESWEESWERNHGKRNHGKGIMGGESWEEESWEEELSLERLPRGSQEAPRGTQEHPGGTQAPRRHPGGTHLRFSPLVLRKAMNLACTLPTLTFAPLFSTQFILIHVLKVRFEHMFLKLVF